MNTSDNRTPIAREIDRLNDEASAHFGTELAAIRFSEVKVLLTLQSDGLTDLPPRWCPEAP